MPQLPQHINGVKVLMFTCLCSWITSYVIGSICLLVITDIGIAHVAHSRYFKSVFGHAPITYV